MKKSIAITLISLLACGATYADLSWGYDGDLLAWDTSIEIGWLVQMYQDVSSDSSLSSISAFSSLGAPSGSGVNDDILLNFTDSLSLGKDNTYWFTDIPAGDWSSYLGNNVYTVLYNSISIATATEAVVLDGSSVTLGLADPSTYSIDSVNNNWVAVPEPATAMLLALGGGFAWLVRLKQRLK